VSRDRLGVAAVLRLAAAAGLPSAVAPVPLRDLVLKLVLHLALHLVLVRVLALSPGDEIPAPVPPSRPFAK
jgi:hypothetical protein